MPVKRIKNNKIKKQKCGQRGATGQINRFLDYSCNDKVTRTEGDGGFAVRDGDFAFEDEAGMDLAGKRVMKIKYRVREQLDLCNGDAAEELVLIDEDGNQFELRFRCQDCGMDIYRNK